MLQPERHTVNVRGVKLHYVDWGNNGPPVLLLHGDMRTSRSWDAVARGLFAHFHVISLDARGHGDSDWPSKGYGYKDRIEDLAAFCGNLGLKKVTGVGHSTGGVVLALYAKKYPGTFNRLVLLEPVVVIDEAFQKMIAAKGKQPRRTWANREQLYDYLKQHDFTGHWREDVIRDVVNHEALELPDGTIDMKWAAATLDWVHRNGDYHDLKLVLRRLGLPTLFVMSEERQGNFDDLKGIAAKTPNLHMLTVKKTDHNMYMERPDAISWAIDGFAAGHDLPESI